jgi:DNA-binding CsgD family transcriptional regulator
MRSAVKGIGEPVMEAFADFNTAWVEIWEGEAERAIERLERRLESTLKLGAGTAVPFLLLALGFGELGAGRNERARERLEGLVSLIEGRLAALDSWALSLLADARRLLGDESAEAAARESHEGAERFGNRLVAGMASLVLGRLAAARGDWALAQQHALAHLDACVEGGHLTYVPPCLDALGEVAAGLGHDEDAVRLFAAADGARTELGAVRVPAEDEHWSSIEDRLREALGPDGYEAARAEGAKLSTEDALEWARRARGSRKRPPGGWESLTPTEARVVELVAEGLTNPQIGERMFISRATVKTHLAHIFKKLDVHSRTELGALAGARKEADNSAPAR